MRYHTSKIRTLRVGNFKAFGETQTIPIRPITLIFGKNSAGKSSVLQSLALAHELHEAKTNSADVHRTVLGGSSIDLGGFAQFVHKGDKNKSVELEFEFPPENRIKFGEKLINPKFWKSNCSSLNSPPWAVKVSIGIEKVREKTSPISGKEPEEFSVPLVRRIDIHAEGEMFASFHLTKAETNGTWQGSPIESTFGLKALNTSRDHPWIKGLLAQISVDKQPHLHIEKNDEWAAVSTLGNGMLLGTLMYYPPFGGPRPFNELANEASMEFWKIHMTSVMSQISWHLHNALGDLRYIGPLRPLPSDSPLEIGRLSQGGSAWEQLHADPKLLNQVNDWLGRLDIRYNLRTRTWSTKNSSNRRIKRTQLVLRDSRSNTDVRFSDVGIGVSQVMPVLVEALASRGKLIAIEQPELHLHPKLQADLGSLFIDAALGDQNNTFILETHSKLLTERLLRRIRETTKGILPKGAISLRPKDVVVLFVKPEGSQSVVKELRIDEDGDFIDEWPGGFFEESFHEKFAGR